jgi:hypothetical protein
VKPGRELQTGFYCRENASGIAAASFAEDTAESPPAGDALRVLNGCRIRRVILNLIIFMMSLIIDLLQDELCRLSSEISVYGKKTAGV